MMTRPDDLAVLARPGKQAVKGKDTPPAGA